MNILWPIQFQWQNCKYQETYSRPKPSYFTFCKLKSVFLQSVKDGGMNSASSRGSLAKRRPKGYLLFSAVASRSNGGDQSWALVVADGDLRRRAPWPQPLKLTGAADFSILRTKSRTEYTETQRGFTRTHHNTSLARRGGREGVPRRRMELCSARYGAHARGGQGLGRRNRDVTGAVGNPLALYRTPRPSNLAKIA